MDNTASTAHPAIAHARGPKKTCFVAMPLTTTSKIAEEYKNPDHWGSVFDHLIRPAIEAAGFEVVAPARVGSEHITKQIVRDICQADMMVCDLSSGNANVYFELGLRTSLNLPAAVIHDTFHKELPFDIHAINAHEYWLLVGNKNDQIERLKQHVLAAERTSAGRNTLWSIYGEMYTAARDDELAFLRNSLDTAAEDSEKLRKQLSTAASTIVSLEENIATIENRCTETNDQLLNALDRLDLLKNQVRVSKEECAREHAATAQAKREQAKALAELAEAKKRQAALLQELRVLERDDFDHVRTPISAEPNTALVVEDPSASLQEGTPIELVTEPFTSGPEEHPTGATPATDESISSKRQRLVADMRPTDATPATDDSFGCLLLFAVGALGLLLLWLLGHWPAKWLHLHPSHFVDGSPSPFFSFLVDGLVGAVAIAIVYALIALVRKNWPGALSSLIIGALLLGVASGVYVLA